MPWFLKVLLGLYNCDHPMIVQRADGGWYCTECGARRG